MSDNTLAPSSHVDTFARDRLPPPAQWPVFVFDRPEVRYLSFAGRNAPAMRTKIINGQFHLLADDLEYQTRLRGLGRANESF